MVKDDVVEVIIDGEIVGSDRDKDKAKELAIASSIAAVAA